MNERAQRLLSRLITALSRALELARALAKALAPTGSTEPPAPAPRPEPEPEPEPEPGPRPTPDEPVSSAGRLRVVPVEGHAPEPGEVLRYTAGGQTSSVSSSEVMSWSAQGIASTWTRYVSPDEPVASDHVALEDVRQLIPRQLMGPRFLGQLSVGAASGIVRKSLSPSGLNDSAGGLRVVAGVHPFRTTARGAVEVYEVELVLWALEDSRFTVVRFDPTTGGSTYCPDVPEVAAHSGGLVWDPDHTQPFLWLRGQATIRRFLVAAPGARITDRDEERFSAWSHVAHLEAGEGNYHDGQLWGPSGARLPRLDEDSVGFDLVSQRDAEGASRAATLRSRIIGRQSGLGFNYAGLGPWQPYGPRTGGGSGGDGITPYSGWGCTPGEMDAAWWSLRASLERSHTVDYRDASKVPAGSPYTPGQVAWEDDLAGYVQHDLAHGSRAFIHALPLVWTAGSKAAQAWCRETATRYGGPSGFPVEYHGHGHKWAHRSMGWRAALYALQASVTPPGSIRDTVLLYARDHARAMRDIATPSGITHRGADAGPFKAFFSPNPWKTGELPEGTSAARTIMPAIVTHGAFAISFACLGETRTLRPLIVDASRAIYWLRTPPPGHVVLGGEGLEDLVDTPYTVATDTSANTWECLWALAEGFRCDPRGDWLRRAADIMGHAGIPLHEVPGMHYAKQGSKRAVWERSAEAIALIQDWASMHEGAE